MEKFINKLFNYYKCSITRGEFLNFFRKESDYFIIKNYGLDDFENFFNSKNTKKIILDFESECKKNLEMNKNTSLLILLEVQNLKQDYEKLKTQILRIEEDVYFFRKYVILYDKKGNIELEKKINQVDDLIKYINQIKLTSFQKDIFKDSFLFLLIQLFIKIPFLQLEIKSQNDNFNLREQINTKIKEKSLENLNNFITQYMNGWDKNISFEDIRSDILDIDNRNIDSFLSQLIK